MLLWKLFVNMEKYSELDKIRLIPKQEEEFGKIEL